VTEFKTIVADPAWKFGDKLPGKRRGAVKHYRVMTPTDIMRFLSEQKVGIAPDAVLFLWRVSSMPAEALRVIAAWGFDVKSEIVWVKTTESDDRKLEKLRKKFDFGRIIKGDFAMASGEVKQAIEEAFYAGRGTHFGMGRYTRMAHETCLIARRSGAKGSVIEPSRRERSVFFAPVPREIGKGKKRIHSAKPDEFYRIVEKMCDGPYLDIFARKRRPGWESIGDELDGRSSPEGHGGKANDTKETDD